MIAESAIDTVFNDDVIAKLAKLAKLPPGADLDRFGQNVRDAVRSYCAERARTDWKSITQEIEDLYRLLERAERGGEPAAVRLADRLNSIALATRQWIDRCLHLDLKFPEADEVKNSETRQAAITRLRRCLSDGVEIVEGRKRQTGKRSRSRRPLLRVPQHKHGRPRKTAERELVQQFCLAHLEATGQPPPKYVNSDKVPPQPFFKFVCGVFKRAGIKCGYIEDLIKERKHHRKIMELREVDGRPVTMKETPPVTMEETRAAFEKRYYWREQGREAAKTTARQRQAAKAASRAKRSRPRHAY